jgi:DNA primase
MAFSPQFLDELKARLSIVEVVGKRVQLTRKGREHWGLCPFHQEKTPSFSVSDQKGFYHCFGCGAHGSAFDFVMETEGLSFPEAVERLAGLAGMQVPTETPEERARVRRARTLHDVIDKAQAFFVNQLRMPGGAQARDYLARRGLSEATIQRFGIGWAPDSRGALKAALGRDGIEEDLLVEAGLLIRPDDAGRAPYDRFRGRITFPIGDRAGRVIAFGGRTLGDGQPKYLNSPDTPLFNKGRVLYGLAQAREPAHRAGAVLVTEGYMDVIALAQAGFENAVAPLGTAVTEGQLAELWKLAAEPVLCFDGDDAGQRAALRAAERALPLLRPGVSLRFALLPPGEDPDSLIGGNGRSAMQDVVDAALPLSELLWRSIVDEDPAAAAPERRAAMWKGVQDAVRSIADVTVRRSFEEAYKARFWRRPGEGRPGTGRRAAAAPRGPARVDRVRRHEEILLAVLLTHPGLFDRIEERLGCLEFSASELDKLRQEALKTLTRDPALDSATLESHLRQIGFGDLLDDLLSARVLDHAFFARRDVTSETALQGWEETYALYGHRNLRVEIEQAQRRLAEEMSEEALDHLRALQELEQRLSEDGGEAA